MCYFLISFILHGGVFLLISPCCHASHGLCPLLTVVFVSCRVRSSDTGATQLKNLKWSLRMSTSWASTESHMGSKTRMDKVKVWAGVPKNLNEPIHASVWLRLAWIIKIGSFLSSLKWPSERGMSVRWTLNSHIHWFTVKTLWNIHCHMNALGEMFTSEP